MDIRVDYHGRKRIHVGSVLAAQVEVAARVSNYCNLCDAHPGSGHKRDCPLVEEAISKGHELEPEPEQEEEG